MKLMEILKPEAIISALQGATRDDVVWEMAELLVKTYPENNLTKERVGQILLERERLGSTGIGEGIAIPHGRVSGISGMCAALGVSKEGVDFLAIDEQPTRLFFVLLASDRSSGEHLKILARVCRLLKGTDVVPQLMELSSAQEIYDLLAKKDEAL